MRGLKPFFINSDKFLTATRVFSKRIVGNSIEPCGKTRFAAKAADVLVSAQKCLLGEIVRKRKIRSGELAKQTPHAGLMPSDQLAESGRVALQALRDQPVVVAAHVSPTLRRDRPRRSSTKGPRSSTRSSPSLPSAPSRAPGTCSTTCATSSTIAAIPRSETARSPAGSLPLGPRLSPPWR